MIEYRVQYIHQRSNRARNQDENFHINPLGEIQS